MGTLKTLKVSEYRTIDALLGGSDNKPSKLQRIKYIHLMAYINIRNYLIGHMYTFTYMPPKVYGFSKYTKTKFCLVHVYGKFS